MHAVDRYATNYRVLALLEVELEEREHGGDAEAGDEGEQDEHQVAEHVMPAIQQQQYTNTF